MEDGTSYTYTVSATISTPPSFKKKKVVEELPDPVKVTLTEEEESLLNEWTGILKDLDLNIELRIEGQCRFVRNTIIVGYHESHEISPRITLLEGGGYSYEIEHRGHDVLYKHSRDNHKQAFKAYYIYLTSLIDFCDLQSERGYTFPELIQKDRRTDTIKEILT